MMKAWNHWIPDPPPKSRIVSTIFLVMLMVHPPWTGQVEAAAGIEGAKVARDSGEWRDIAWDPDGIPGRGDVVVIGGGLTVNFSGGSSGNLSRLYVGAEAEGLVGSEGEMEIVDGTVTLHANAAGAISLGYSDGSSGTLRVSGGKLEGIGDSSGSGMRIGSAAGSTGHFTITQGELTLANGVIVGGADGSHGTFIVEGGVVTVSVNMDGGPFNVGGRFRGGGNNTAVYRQTGGSVTIPDHYFGVGHAGAAAQIMDASAEITGGTLKANVRVGRQANVSTGGGDEASLRIGHAAELQGLERTWYLGGNGHIVFVLGENADFNSVDLTSIVDATAFEAPQAGARITVDGSNLAFSADYPPVDLIIFGNGVGPSDLSQSNLSFDFVGFDNRFQPNLEWTDSSLRLGFNASR